jgi:hypothetical protein
MFVAKVNGQRNNLTCAVGEHLVAAELNRRGLRATTFAGNVPHYDIMERENPVRPFSFK